ncbi:hypothetical protein MBLNU459_g1605t1 [Dothideomycetes sp. NU459]
MVYSKSTLSLAATLLSLGGSVDAFWRLPCRSRTGLARIDPIMDSGVVSDHVHAIHGGNNFGMSSTPYDLVDSDCTSCEVTQDKSAYWTPSLHFMYPNGSSVMVEQVGGMLAYYLLYPDDANPTGKITAFPEGFQMISGDKRVRNFTWPVPDPAKSEWTGDQVSQFALSQKALGFNCLNYAAAAEGSLYRHFLPTKDYLDANCLDGIRLELMFPSCWNGKDLDSSDHRSHVAFPDLVMTGSCPDGFGTKLPSLFYETIWNTAAFAGVDGEFVLSTGDPTGYGYHGDFQMGWNSQDFLQSAVDTCTNASGEIQDCPLFDIQSDSVAAQCTFKEPDELSDDNPLGPRDGLPISVPIQSGPAYASTYAVVLANDATVSSASSAAASTTSSAAQSSQTSAVVPTLSYSAATASVTDQYGGGILVANTAATYVPSDTSSAAASSTVESSAAAPAVTSAASLESAVASNNAVATSIWTSGNQVIEMMIEEVDITVTATAMVTPNAKNRRHLQEHQHRRVRHNSRR